MSAPSYGVAVWRTFTTLKIEIATLVAVAKKDKAFWDPLQ